MSTDKKWRGRMKGKRAFMRCRLPKPKTTRVVTRLQPRRHMTGRARV